MSLSKHKLIQFKNFIQEKTDKNQIYLHHTAGGPSGEQVFSWWDSDRTPVATCVAISRDGTIVQGFHSMYWAYHLGLTNQVFAQQGLPFKALDKTSIGIELCSYGWAEFKQGNFYNYVGGKLAKEDVIELDKPFKGHKFYQRYTPAQIDSVCELLLLWKQRYGINIEYKPEEFWKISKKALSGENGLYSHNSVRADKTDVFPDPHLITALESL